MLNKYIKTQPVSCLCSRDALTEQLTVNGKWFSSDAPSKKPTKQQMTTAGLTGLPQPHHWWVLLQEQHA